VKFYSFEAGKRVRLGLEHGGQIADLPLLHFLLSGNDQPSAGAAPVIPPDMLAFVRAGKPALEAALTIQTSLKKRRAIPAGEQVFYDLDSVRILQPLLKPGKILLAEVTSSGTRDAFRFQVKLPSTLVGSGAEIRTSATLLSRTYVAGVIGRKTKSAGLDEVMENVFGCTLLNDLRLNEAATENELIAANHDNFCPAGPTLCTMDEVDLNLPNVTCQVKGVTQEISLPDWGKQLAQVISSLSQSITLEPGDLVGLCLNPKTPVELAPGEMIRLESSFGTLENQLAASNSDAS
jgi:2-keto-4-pentenoate hydratase/2-oxohepta-3-ene-1,7-dioic acid hydratase in catechol pathway